MEAAKESKPAAPATGRRGKKVEKVVEEEVAEKKEEEREEEEDEEDVDEEEDEEEDTGWIVEAQGAGKVAVEPATKAAGACRT